MNAARCVNRRAVRRDEQQFTVERQSRTTHDDDLSCETAIGATLLGLPRLSELCTRESPQLSPSCLSQKPGQY